MGTLAVDYDLSDVLTVESDGPIRIVTLNRPEHLNSFDDELHAEFARLWQIVERDDEARAVVLTGAGKAFCAGGNIEDFIVLREDLARRRKTLRWARRLVDEMLNVHVPVVAAVNGPAVGLGCTLTTLCDIVFLSEAAFLADPHVSVALVAGDGSAITWPSMTSLLKAKQYLLTGDRIPPAEALGDGSGQLRGPARAAASRRHRLRASPCCPAAAGRPGHQVPAEPVRCARRPSSALGYGLAAESQSHDTQEYRRVPEQFAGRQK